MAIDFKNLFGPSQAQPLEQPDPLGVSGLFGDAQFLQQEPESLLPTSDIASQMEKVNANTKKRAEEIRDQGLFARYPVIETPEDEEKERARLARRGLDEKEIDRRIAKFKSKGGKVKTSSKVLAAATLLSGGIKGYLAAKRGQPIPQGTGLAQLQAEAQKKIDLEVDELEKDAEEQKALILQKDKREFQTFLEELKVDRNLRVQLNKEARELGVDVRGKTLEQAAKDVIDEQARRATAKEELVKDKEARLLEGQETSKAGRRVTIAVQLNDPSLASDRDLATFFEIDPSDQEAIDEARSRMESQARLRSLAGQETLLGKETTRQIGQKKLDEPPKETPEAKFEREQTQREQIDQKEALKDYQQSIGAAAAGFNIYEDNPEKQQAIILISVSKLRLAQPDMPHDEAVQKVLSDIGASVAAARGVSQEQIDQLLGQ